MAPGALGAQNGVAHKTNGELPMSLIQRVQDILLKPKETWQIIAGEGGDTALI